MPDPVPMSRSDQGRDEVTGPTFLWTRSPAPGATILLAHGAGAPMDTPFMEQMTGALVARDLSVARFEFAYMAARRTGGPKRPPPRMPPLCEEFRAAVAALAPDGPLIVAGKSMGGRVASLVAQELHDAGAIAGLLCLGYPFHPTGKPDSLRTAHLQNLRVPTLICQGTRDPFGTHEEVAGYDLSDSIGLLWLEDGDHDFKPRKRVTGETQSDLIERAAQGISDWADTLRG